jgi:hypothetical protein
MDPIQPIERRSPWISELAAAQAQDVSRERRKMPRGTDRKTGPRRSGPPGRVPPISDRSSHEEQGPEEDGPEGRRIDVRA